MILLNMIGDWLGGYFFGLMIWIVSLVYEVVTFALKIFMILANGKLLEEINYDLLVQNFYTILGVLMLFVIAFALLRMIINPEEQKQGTSVIKKMIINLVTSVIIIAFLPTIFAFAFDVQNSIIGYNVLGGFFGFGNLGNQTLTSEPIDVVGVHANKLVNSIFTAFFNVDSSWCQAKLKEEEQSFDTHLEEITWCQQQVKGDKKLEIVSGLLTFTPVNEEDADKFSTYVEHVSNTGDFGVYTAFADNVSEGEIKFSVIACIAAGIFTAYIAVSYCFDMALRLIKLIFYQLIAPIPIFLRVIPYGKMSSIFNQWLKITLTCWAEVFVRILILFFSVFVISKLTATEFLSEDVYNYGLLLGLFANAFVIIGIILFMKKSPKLISEVTGIDSGNMKLGIKDKLAESGVLTAGAVLGAGVTSGIRGFTSAFERGEDGNWHKKEGSHAIRSAIAGATSGAVRGGKAGWNAKSFKDMKAAASSGAQGAADARVKRANYKAAHGGTIGGVITGHVADASQAFGAYLGIGANESVLSFYSTASSAADSINSASKGTYEGKKAYQDQEAIVKSLKADVGTSNSEYSRLQGELNKFNQDFRNAIISGDDEAKADALNSINEITNKMSEQKASTQKLAEQLKAEEQKLDTIRLDASEKKKDILATAATRLGDNQNKNYANNKELAEAYTKALESKFNITIDEQGNISGATGHTLDMIKALQNGEVVNTDWIDRSNIIQLQDFIDEVSVQRHNVQGAKEREFIVSSQNGGQSSGNKDK